MAILGDETEKVIREIVRHEMEVREIERGTLTETIREVVIEEIQLNKEEKGQAPNTRFRAGAMWSDFEERDLIRELKEAIIQMAIRHERSEISISYKLDNLNKRGAFCDFKDSKAWKGG